MNLINQKVTHKTFGEGSIVSLRESGINYTRDVPETYLEISFEKVGMKKFIFPTSFEQFLTFKETESQEEVKKMIVQKGIEKEERRERDEMIRAYKQKLVEEQEKNAKITKGRGRKKKEDN